MDSKVLEAQQWYNTTYRGTTGFIEITEDGITGARTCKALVRALQYEFGLSVDGSFGAGTLSKCPTIGMNTTSENLVKIVQCGFYCKGYSCGGIDGDYGLATQSAALAFKEDAGFPDSDEDLQPVFVRALLNTDAFKLVRTGKAYIRAAQQYLNANYIIKTSLIALIPCNGVADRNMTKAIIIALQYEEARQTMAGVDGIYGNNTLNKAPELSGGSTKTAFIKIAQMCLMMMYENPGLSGKYDSYTEKMVKEFQEFSCLTQDSRVVPGVIGRTTWASLLSSKGDSSRTATACDCSEQILSIAKAQKLKEGYNIVGRYLTGTVGASKPKNLSPGELQILAEHNLRVFPIFQDGGAALTYFGNYQGQLDAKDAIIAARKLHIPNDTIIYFAVDYDFTEKQVLERVIPHFEGIKAVFDASLSKYRIGIYGSRNTCTIVCNNNLAVSSFVSDMSTGYSGNMGFPLPKNWAFDQIYEYTATASDGTKFAVDKNVSSGRDQGFMWGDLCGGDRFDDCTQHSLVLGEDGYYKCMSCDYQVCSPFLQDGEILTEQDYLKMKVLAALYSVAMGDDTYRNLLYSISCAMTDLRNKEEYKGKYEYRDINGDSLVIEPQGEYNSNRFPVYIREPETITNLNINSYNGVFDVLAQALYGIAVDTKYNLSLSDTVMDLAQNPDLTMTMYEIVKALAAAAHQTEWGYILTLIQIGVNITDAEANSKARLGDIGIKITYQMGGSMSMLGDAVVIFDSNGNIKSVGF